MAKKVEMKFEWDENKNSKNKEKHKIDFEEAKTIFDDPDAMVLSRGGVVIPDQNIYYNDEDIEYDEDIDELTITSGIINLSWEEKVKRAENQERQRNKKGEVMVDLSTRKPEIDDWIVKNKKKIETLLKPIVESLFDAEKVIKG